MQCSCNNNKAKQNVFLQRNKKAESVARYKNPVFNAIQSEKNTEKRRRRKNLKNYRLREEMFLNKRTIREFTALYARLRHKLLVRLFTFLL